MVLLRRRHQDAPPPAPARLDVPDGAAEGASQASEKLLEASQVLARTPQAMQLRYLQTLTSIAGDKSSTIVFPMPLDMFEAVSKVLSRKEGGAD